jgi:hypothetical protein
MTRDNAGDALGADAGAGKPFATRSTAGQAGIGAQAAHRTPTTTLCGGARTRSGDCRRLRRHWSAQCRGFAAEGIALLVC